MAGGDRTCTRTRRSGWAPGRGVCSSTRRCRCRRSAAGPRTCPRSTPTRSRLSSAAAWTTTVASAGAIAGPPTSPEVVAGSRTVGSHRGLDRAVAEQGGVAGPGRFRRRRVGGTRAGPDRPGRRGLGRRRCWRAVGRSADPDRALVTLGPIARRRRRPDELVAALSGDERTAGAADGRVGLSTALADHLVRHPEHWHDLVDLEPERRPDAGELRASMLRVGRRRPDGRRSPWPSGAQLDALRVAYRRQVVADCGARPDRRPRPGGRLGRAGGPGGGDSGRRPGGRPGRPAAGRNAVPAGRDRDGQMRRPRAELRLRRRRRSSSRRPWPASTRRPSHAHRDGAGLLDDAGLLGPHGRGHHLAGRRRASARRVGRPAGANAGQPPRLLPDLGQDLGVPGAAQGPTDRGRHASSARHTWTSDAAR